MHFRWDVLVHIAALQKTKLGNIDSGYNKMEYTYAVKEVNLFASVFRENGQYQHAEVLH